MVPYFVGCQKQLDRLAARTLLSVRLLKTWVKGWLKDTENKESPSTHLVL